MRKPALLLLAFLCTIAPGLATAAGYPADPLKSPMWDMHAKRLFGGAPVVFDKALKMEMPVLAEDQHVFPVAVDATALKDVRRIVIFADLNPIPVALDYTPVRAAAYVATRIKLDQRTPVRAAVLTADGTWHVAGNWVDAAGGGCSAPPRGRVKGDWAEHLGEMRGEAWQEGGHVRLRFTVRHPMDTGLVENVPAYNLDAMTVRDAAGTVLGRMVLYGALSEDPAFTLAVDPSRPGPISISLHDTNGREFEGNLPDGGGSK
ncbi:quinoprotein dehydrogenase-associated SoxYZ-like carrier [Novosphingobium sp. ZN18A2]|uniref:quinoprotein dehydrogenase-associated SoxYZ-like carrier n=1 Tax=Novosphingobium sp. ZN18A2 TaxID=3079861 RepID=UPI0030CD69FE